MLIHNSTLIVECSAYDFKEILERKKVKSWLKSVSAFANTDGGSLFYGVNDDGVIVGLENPQADADFICEMIKARLGPVPEVQLIPIELREPLYLPSVFPFIQPRSIIWPAVPEVKITAPGKTGWDRKSVV